MTISGSAGFTPGSRNDPQRHQGGFLLDVVASATTLSSVGLAVAAGVVGSPVLLLVATTSGLVAAGPRGRPVQRSVGDPCTPLGLDEYARRASLCQLNGAMGRMRWMGCHIIEGLPHSSKLLNSA